MQKNSAPDIVAFNLRIKDKYFSRKFPSVTAYLLLLKNNYMEDKVIISFLFITCIMVKQLFFI